MRLSKDRCGSDVRLYSFLVSYAPRLRSHYFRTIPDATPRNNGADMTKKVLRRKAVEAKTGNSTSTIYEKMAAGEFPKPIKLGARAVGWLEDEIDGWIERRLAERDRKAA